MKIGKEEENIFMRNSKLSEHTFKKGRFITPLNSLPMMNELEDEKSWTYGRMPEYIWIGLILKYFGREEGLKKLYYIISKIHKIVTDIKARYEYTRGNL